MKICFLADAKSTHTIKWATFFRDHCHDVHIITFQYNDIEGVHVHPLYKTIPVFINHTSSILLKYSYLFYLRQVKQKIFEIMPDILHAHWMTSYGLMGAYSNYHPFIVSAWGRDIYKAQNHHIFYKLIIRYVCKHADMITATSRHLMVSIQSLLKMKEIPIIQIPFGVDVNHFTKKKNNKNETLTIGVVKYLEPYYGIEYLIKAFHIIARKKKNIKLCIIGEGSQFYYLNSLSKELGLLDQVNFLGPIPHQEISQYLSKFDIFVLPSIIEAFGVSALEAAASEIPVIASNVGGLPEVVLDGKTGFLVEPKDIHAIAEKMELLIDNIDLRRSLGREGRKYVKDHFDWYENAQRMEDLYMKILK